MRSVALRCLLKGPSQLIHPAARFPNRRHVAVRIAAHSLGGDHIDPCIQFAVCRAYLRDDPPVPGPFERVETGPVIGQVCRFEQMNLDDRTQRIENQAARTGAYRFLTTGDPVAFREAGRRFLQLPIADVEHVAVSQLEGAAA